MRPFVTIVVVIAILCILAPTPALADLEARIKKLENEILTIKEALKNDAANFFSTLPTTLSTTAQAAYDRILHLGGTTAGAVQKEYPKWLSWGQKYAQDLPTHAGYTAQVLQREGSKWYSRGVKELSAFLSKQGVPSQYIQYVTLGVIALVLLVTALITFYILSAVLGFICRCGGRKRQTATARKKEKRAASQARDHDKRVEQDRKQDNERGRTGGQ